MQEYFRDKGQSIMKELNLTIDSCHCNNILVIYTQHGHRNLSVDGGSLGRKWGQENLIKYESQEWKLLPELKICDSDKIIDEKTTYDGFHKTCLEAILRDHMINTVVISGLITELCCETTARSAFVKGFDVLFLSNGTNSHDIGRHNSTLACIEYGIGKVLSCEEFRTLINKDAR